MENLETRQAAALEAPVASAAIASEQRSFSQRLWQSKAGRAAMAATSLVGFGGISSVAFEQPAAAYTSNPTCDTLSGTTEHGCVTAGEQGLTFNYNGYGAGSHYETADYTDVTTGAQYHPVFQWSGDSTSIPEPLPGGEYKGSFGICPEAGGLCDSVQFDLVAGSQGNGGGGCPTGINHLAPGTPWATAATKATVNGQECPGEWVGTRVGGVISMGAAQWLGDVSNIRLNQPIVDIKATPDNKGYWLVASDGGVFTEGDAKFYGSTGGIRLNQPVVGMAPTHDGKGYWLVAADGGIFTFGDAVFHGSTGNIRLNQPVVGMAATPDGSGYWLVAADGGIFSFGDAPFYGSTGSIKLNQPMVGMTVQPDGKGYRMVAKDGGVFSFGDAAFYGSLPGEHVDNPAVTTMAPSLDGNGYYLISGGGGNYPAGTIWNFGDAAPLGNA